MLNVLFIVHTFPPMGSVGGSIRIVKFLKYIFEFNPEIRCSVLTLTDKKVLLHDPLLANFSLSEIPGSVEIIRTKTFQPKHPNPSSVNPVSVPKDQGSAKDNKLKSIFKKIYFAFENNLLIPDYGILWFPFLAKNFLKIIKEKKFDLVYATAPPFSAIVMAAFLTRLIKKKLILDIKDDWIYQPRYLKKKFFVRKIELLMERFCIKSADKVILVTENSYNDFKTRYPEFQNKFYLITNGCDVSEYRNFWNIDKTRNSKFLMLHSGGLAESRDLSNFFSAIAELKNENILRPDNFEFLFIGKIPESIWHGIYKNKLDDVVTVIDYMEREDYIKKLFQADLLLAVNYQIKTLIPGKIYDYWGSRNPIMLIDNPNSAAANLITKHKLGSVNEFNDKNGIKESILFYFNKWNNSEQCLSNTEGIENYDRKNLTKKLLELMT